MQVFIDNELENVQYDWVRVLNRKLENPHDKQPPNYCLCRNLKVESEYVSRQRNLVQFRNVDTPPDFAVQNNEPAGATPSMR